MSPIKGITGEMRAGLTRIGKLRKGAPRPASGRMPGKDLPTFRFTSERADVQATWDEAFPKPPSELTIYFASPRIEDCWEAWQEEYGGGGLIHRCDGETMVLWLGDDGKYHEDPKPCPYHSGEKTRQRDSDGCQPKGRLRFLVWELARRGHVGEVWLETGSFRDIQNIEMALNGLWQTPRTEGLMGIPFILRRVEGQTSYTTPEGKRARVSKFFVELEPAAEYMRMRLTQMRNRVLEGGAALAIEAPAGDLFRKSAISPSNDWSEDDEDPYEPESDDRSDEPIEGQATEVREPEPEQATGGRPYDPETCRKGILALAIKYRKDGRDERGVDTGFRGWLTGTLEGLFEAAAKDQRPQLRHSLLAFIFGQTSIKELPPSAIEALADWATKKNAEGVREVVQHAKSEAIAMVTACEVAAGQTELPLGGADG